MKSLWFPLAFAGSLALAGTAFAADDDSTPAKPVSCEAGQVWDKKSKACVTKDSNLIDDDTRFEAARSFASAGQYENARDTLYAMSDQSAAKTLNLLGYTSRKLGQREIAMGYYKAALKKDPNYLLARSYMGQALANEGKFEEALAQLSQIRDRGGRETWAYVSLKQHLGNRASY